MKRDKMGGADGLLPGVTIEELPPVRLDSKGPAPARGGRLLVSAPGGLVATLLVAALAFAGAVAMPASDPAGHDGKVAVTEPTDKPDTVEPTDKPDTAEPTDKPDTVEPTDKPDVSEPIEKPAPDPTDKPTPKPTEKPDAPKPTEKPAAPDATPKPEVGTMALELRRVESCVKLDWSAYGGDGLSGYKVVRSLDAGVSWPLGEADSVVAFVGADGATAAADCKAPGGRKVYYRVFAVHKGEDGYRVLAASAVRYVWVPEPEPAPDPVVLGLEVDAIEGGVALHWQACTSDRLVGYKVVRSKVNEDPRYPLNDGTELVAFVEAGAATEWFDAKVEPGQTWHYRVYALGKSEAGWVILGVTPVRSATAG